MNVVDMGEWGTALMVHESLPWAEVLAVSGELDLAVVPQFGSALDELLRGSLPVVLDLSGCSYLDSTILRVLVGASNSSPNRFAMVVPEEARIRRVFQIAGLETTLPIGASRENLQLQFAKTS
ncbi:MAG: STAS domain-containing protein [Candidatus Aquilonibacter sp.]|jgi:anti-anti-sigma factor